MKLTSVLLNLSTFFGGLAAASHADPRSTLQTLAAKPAVLINKRYPESNFIRTPDTPQNLCGDIKDLNVVANSIDHNITIGNCEALRDMYVVNSTADGNGYWNFTFGTSDQNDTGGLSQFTVDFYGHCEMNIGLVDYSGVPFDVE